MVISDFYKLLLLIRKIKNVKLIISGDFDQLPCIGDIKEYNYKESQILKELCDHNLLNLTKWRRGDMDMESIKFSNIDNFNKEDFGNNFTELNVCWTNKTRININNIIMTQKYKKAKTKNYIKLSKLEHDDNSQDLILLNNTPIISKINNRKLNIINNERFIIKKVNVQDKTLFIKNDRLELTINSNIFQKLFRVGYCCTTYCTQGMSINQSYTIHEFDLMNKHHKYVALSRGCKREFINII